MRCSRRHNAGAARSRGADRTRLRSRTAQRTSTSARRAAMSRPSRWRIYWVASRVRSILASAACRPVRWSRGSTRRRASAASKCIQACPVDAIVGASRFMHTVIADAVHRLRAVHPALPRRLHRHATRPGGRAATWPARSDSRDYARAGDVTMARTSGVRGGLRLDAHKQRSTAQPAPDSEPSRASGAALGSARGRSRSTDRGARRSRSARAADCRARRRRSAPGCTRPYRAR